MTLTRRGFAVGAASLLSPAVLRAGTAPVVVIGAGAAGMTAAYTLAAAGRDVRVLEAAPRWGGRVKRLDGFASVPLDLGAEWIHTDPKVLGLIMGQGPTDLGVDTIEYRPETYLTWHRGQLQPLNGLAAFYTEDKFRDTTWYGFFERFMLPALAGKITLNAPVTAISRTTGQLRVHHSGGVQPASHVIVTVPLSMLQRGAIAFDGLPGPVPTALARARFGHGFKVFFKFTERFWPDMLLEGPRARAFADIWDSKLYYDAMLGKGRRDAVLGLFTVAEGRLYRAGLSDQALIETALAELAERFGSVVRASFEKAVVQNWSAEPFIAGSYSMSGAERIAHLLRSISGLVFFAGEVLGGGAAQSTAHGAALSGRRAALQILGG